MNSFNPEKQLENTEPAITKKIKNLLNELRGYKFNMILALNFKKSKSKDETKFCTFHSNSKAERIILDADIDSIFELILSTVMTKIQNYQPEDSGCIIGSVIEQNINILVKHQNLASLAVLWPALGHPQGTASLTQSESLHYKTFDLRVTGSLVVRLRF